LPDAAGLPPGYEQKRFDDDRMRNALRLVASSDGEDGSLTIHQDARIYLSNLDAGETIEFPIPSGRNAWLQVLRGSVTLNGGVMHTSDGAAASDEATLSIAATSDAEIMLLDLA
jgi:redox-sensitive bicupin YhaK (pirin superfamily)